MTNKIVGYIGCAKCETVLFRLEGAPLGGRPIFEHVLVQLGDAMPGTKICPNMDCQESLVRVPDPK